MSSTGIEVTGPLLDRFDEILTEDALSLIADLHRRFEDRRQDLLAARARRQEEISRGGTLDFLAETKSVREDPDWRVAPPAPGLADRRVEITGPTDRKMTINALNYGAKVWLADFEDANTPLWENMIGGQLNLRDALDRTIDFTSPEGKSDALADAAGLATIVVRPRGWHLDEKHILVDGRRVSGGLVDFALYFFHCARRQLDKGKVNLFHRQTDDFGQWYLPVALNVPGVDAGYNQLGSRNRIQEIITTNSNDTFDGPDEGTDPDFPNGGDPNAANPTIKRLDLDEGRGWKGSMTGGSVALDISESWTLTDRFSYTQGDANTTGLVPDGGAVQVGVARDRLLGVERRRATWEVRDRHGRPEQDTAGGRGHQVEDVAAMAREETTHRVDEVGDGAFVAVVELRHRVAHGGSDVSDRKNFSAAEKKTAQQSTADISHATQYHHCNTLVQHGLSHSGKHRVAVKRDENSGNSTEHRSNG